MSLRSDLEILSLTELDVLVARMDDGCATVARVDFDARNGDPKALEAGYGRGDIFALAAPEGIYAELANLDEDARAARKAAVWSRTI